MTNEKIAFLLPVSGPSTVNDWSLAARQIMKQAKHLLICGKLLLKKQIRTSLELITGEYD